MDEMTEEEAEIEIERMRFEQSNPSEASTLRYALVASSWMHLYRRRMRGQIDAEQWEYESNQLRFAVIILSTGQMNRIGKLKRELDEQWEVIRGTGN